jgi:hypothetical protein
MLSAVCSAKKKSVTHVEVPQKRVENEIKTLERGL